MCVTVEETLSNYTLPDTEILIGSEMGRTRAPAVDSEDSMDDGMKMARKGFAQQERIMRRIRFKSISEERRRYNTNGCSRMNTRYS